MDTQSNLKKAMEFKIESNIPIPEGRIGSIYSIIRKLNVGDSFEFEASRKNTISGSAVAIKSQKPDSFDYMIRKVSDTHYRIWRTK